MTKEAAQKAARRFAAAMRLERTLTLGSKQGKPLTEKKKEKITNLLNNTKRKIV